MRAGVTHVARATKKRGLQACVAKTDMPEPPGCPSTGGSNEELKDEIQAAVALYVEETQDDCAAAPLPGGRWVVQSLTAHGPRAARGY